MLRSSNLLLATANWGTSEFDSDLIRACRRDEHPPKLDYQDLPFCSLQLGIRVGKVMM